MDGAKDFSFLTEFQRNHLLIAAVRAVEDWENICVLDYQITGVNRARFTILSNALFHGKQEERRIKRGHIFLKLILMPNLKHKLIPKVQRGVKYDIR